MSRNKRWLGWFLAAVLCLAPMGAWAEGGEEAPPAEMPEAGSFAIDTTHVYAGMDRAYQSGYTPTVKMEPPAWSFPCWQRIYRGTASR